MSKKELEVKVELELESILEEVTIHVDEIFRMAVILKRTFDVIL